MAVIADYRVRCRDEVTPTASAEDAEAAYGWLQDHVSELGIDKSRVIVSGGSAGGQLALITALNAPEKNAPAGLVLFNPVVDMTAPLIREATGLSETESRKLSPASGDLARLPRSIIFHGTDDTLVPIASVRAFCDRARAAASECVLDEYAGQKHGFFNNHTVVSALGVAPYADTLQKAVAFLGVR